MKRHLLYIIALLLTVGAQAQTDDYNPSNPPNPVWPEDGVTALYNVTCEAIPNGAGSFSGAHGNSYAEGRQVSVYAYDHNDCYFQCWKDAEGNTLSDKSSYSFTMPAHNVKIYAIYSYAPNNPAQPQMTGNFMLRVKAEPIAAATFNFTDGKVKEGTTQSIYPYINSGFRLVGWYDENNNLVSEKRDLSYLMPSHPSTLTAKFVYEPDAPFNPATNLWDSAAGEMIVDFFDPSSLNYTMRELCKNQSAEFAKVARLTVDGQMTSYDWYFADNFKNLLYVDLSRVDGITEVPSNIWNGNTNLMEVELPECITYIGQRAFNGCTALQYIDCYALVPPTVGTNAFAGIPEGTIMFVPEQVVELYQQADGWKDFTISPLRSKFCTLEVTAPDAANAEYIELVNAKSGRTYRYYVRGKEFFSFPNLIRNTTYNIYFKTDKGKVLLKSDLITMDEELVEVTTEPVPEGVAQIVSLQFVPNTILSISSEWLDADKNVMTDYPSWMQGPTDLVPDDIVYLHAWIDDPASLVGYQPLDTLIECKYPFDEVSIRPKYRNVPCLSVQLVDDIKQKAYSAYSATRTFLFADHDPFVKKYGNAEMMALDGKGSYDNIGVEGRIEFVVSGYNAVTINIDPDVLLHLYNNPADIDKLGNLAPDVKKVSTFEEDGKSYLLLTASITPATAVAEIPVETTFFNTVDAGEELLPDEGLKVNIPFTYDIVNTTTGQALNTFTADNGVIKIMSGATAGDELSITAQLPADYSQLYYLDQPQQTLKVSRDNTPSLNLVVRERPTIHARFLVTDNAEVVSYLYDSKGNLVPEAKKGVDYHMFDPKDLIINTDNEVELTSEDPNAFRFHVLPGTYTLITMGYSNYFSRIADLSQFGSLGLQEGVDYVKNTIVVEPSRNVEVRNVVVPFFDETKFYYTGSSTAFNVNRPNTTVGNYLTFSAHIDFRDDVKDRVKDVQLHIPDNPALQFVEGSLMQGGKLIDEEHADMISHADGKTTVLLGDDYVNITKLIKYCVIPTEYGNYNINPYITFQLDDETITQPIGTASFTANALTIWAPALVSTNMIHIDGNAPRNSRVEVYDNGFWIGETTSNSAGYWSLDTWLYVPYNMSMHSLYGKVYTSDEQTYTTEYRFVEYNEDAIQAKTVDMTFFNPLVNRTIDVLFDLERSKASVNSYSFASGVEFVFTADLTNNSPDKVLGCDIRVFTNNHEWITLPAQYIPNLDRWVAHSKFTGETMPIGVRVEVESEASPKIDLDYLQKLQPQVVINAKPRNDQLADAPARDARPLAADAQPVSFDISRGDGSVWTYFCAAPSSIDLSAYRADTVAMPTTGTDSIYIYYKADDSFVVVGDMADALWGMNLKSAAPGVKSRISQQRIEMFSMNGLKAVIARLNELLNIMAAETPVVDQRWLVAIYQNTLNQLGMYQGQESDYAKQEVERCEKLLDIYQKLIVNWDNLAEIVREGNQLLSYANYGIRDENDWQQFCDRILPCDGLDDPQARALAWLSERQMRIHGWRYIAAFDLVTSALEAATQTYRYWNKEDQMLLYSQLADNIDQICLAANYITHFATNLFLQNKAESRIYLRHAMREKNSYVNCNYDFSETIEAKWDFSLPYPVVEPIIDPSGYVYEGVSSNRLEGVTATAFYKHRYEDMYGDLKEDIVKWDAENYGQENPLITDEQGEYGWDVPSGTWQVKFEKEGYETTYSDWLPVPPPQLDVNIGMKQVSQPYVVKARAFEKTGSIDGGVEITFDKYMDPSTLTTDNIYIKGVKGGSETFIDPLTITFPTLETAIEGSDRQYTTKVYVATDQLSLYDEAYIIVGNRVESYAGIPMASTFQQKIEVEKRLESIATDETLNIAYTDATTVRIAALPTEAAAGRKVRVSTQSAKIANIGTDSLQTVTLTLDSDGQAEFTLNGALYGTTALDFEVIDEDITALTAVSVVDAAMLEEVKEPIASRISGTAVFRGQTVTLACETEGAQIYYTTDGTCPCESPTRRLYTGPIAINDAMELNIMAVGVNGTESTVHKYNYSIRQAHVGLNLAEGWNWVSHDMAAPLPVEDIKSLVYKVQTQTEEVINDPVVGFTGNITEILASQAVKIQTTAAGQKVLSGEQFNPQANIISLAKGWNWIGYPLDLTLTLADAFRHLAVEEGDVVTNLEGGFAQYTDGSWTGTLTNLTPGQGYLYKAASAKQFVYNDQPTESAGTKPRFVPVNSQLSILNCQLSLNPHRYPSLMAITATLDADDADRYIVAVFDADMAGLRGVAQPIDGRLYISAHGEKAEPLRFVAIDRETGDVLPLAETIDFSADVLGSAKAPYVLHLGDATAIHAIDGLTPALSEGEGAIYNIAGQRVADSYRGIVIKNGKKVLNK